MSKTIYLFRHGQTDWNLVRRMQGHTDIPLNAEGRLQAQTLQTFFQQNSVELFASSDLIRAQETARIANTYLQKPFHVSAQFREVNLGVLEGLTQIQAHEKFGMSSWEKWTSLNPADFDFCFPQGETTNAAIARFSKALESFCDSQSFTTAGICTHGLVLRRFLHSLLPDLTEPLPIPNCVVYTVKWDSKKRVFSALME